ncbi:MAG: hypothetical protein WCS31_03560 [Verrucomicrobiae bacterium]
MDSWHLIAPDWASLDSIWRSPQPFLLWPVCDKPLLAYWLDEAVRRGVPSVTIEAVDRPHLVRRWLDQRDLWSRSIVVHAQPGRGEGRECLPLRSLPGAEAPAIESAGDLLRHWYGLQVEALRRRSSGMVHLDHEYRPGIWFGPGARASADAVFTPPCWVGSHASIGPGCRVGPQSFIGPGVFLDRDVEIVESVVCAETYVGSHTTMKHMAAQGGLLMDLERGVGVEVLDEFVLAPLGASASEPSWAERLLAAVVALPLEAIARLAHRGAAPAETVARLTRSRSVRLHTYATGPLCLLRAGWLRHVAAGKMRLVGVLPRGEADWAGLSAEARSVLERAPAGVFALSDLYGCHSPGQPDEWMHAVFQAGAADGAGQRLARNNFFRIALTTPIEP